jgi:hypothetical protein
VNILVFRYIFEEIVVLYGCETWSLTLREKCGLRVFEDRALRRIFGPKREEVTGGWRKLHNDEMGRKCSTNGAKRNAYRILMGEPEEKRSLEGPRRRWVDNIKMDLGGIG